MLLILLKVIYHKLMARARPCKFGLFSHHPTPEPLFTSKILLEPTSNLLPATSLKVEKKKLLERFQYQKILEEIIVENFHKMGKEIATQAQETQRVLSRINPKQNTVQFSSVAKSCPTLCDPMDCSTTGCPSHHQLLELT